MTDVRFTVATAPAPGAIGLIELRGSGVGDVVSRLTGSALTDRARLADFAGIDEGLVVPLRPDVCQLMPHAGPRVMQRLADQLIALGASPDTDASPRDLYPEAASDFDADLLHALAFAASPAAIDLLLDQPRRWRTHLASPLSDAASGVLSSSPLDHLLKPPTVVLIGPPNVGKSTLSNLVLGRAMSLTADLPGTTRDWVAALAQLPTPIGEVAVRWFDTPGLRDSDDPIEQRAIALARRLIASADVLIALTEPSVAFPPAEALPRTPDLFVLNKSDLSTAPPPPDVLPVSALKNEGLPALSAAIARVLGLEDVGSDAPWAFSPPLRQRVQTGDVPGLRAYMREAR
ncbi:MAG: hypothetical protein GC162_11705 [Planctomycetes bacterium]|nr:hypothetical protein [Planctomycetota bacterium]